MAIDERTKKIPLQDTLSSQLIMSGQIAPAGAKLTISDRWQISDGTYWLQVNQLGGKSSAELCLRWVCRRYEGIYVVLEPASSVFERDVQPQYILAEVVNGNTLRLLEPEETEHALPHVQAEIVGRDIWTDTKRRAVLFSDTRSVLGEFR